MIRIWYLQIAAMKKNVNGSNEATRFITNGNNDLNNNNLIQRSPPATLHLLH